MRRFFASHFYSIRYNIRMQKEIKIFSVPAAIIVGAIIISVAIFFGLRSSSLSSGGQVAQGQVQGQAQAAAPTVDPSKINTVNEPFIGNPNAPVTIAYWYDYQCPFCKQDEEQTEGNVIPQIITNYVNAGKVKLIFKDFPFLGADSETLAIAARAVWDVAPSQFYNWHKAIFDAQGQEGSGWASQSEIMSVTTAVLGAADAAKVSSLMASNTTTYQNEIAADKTEGNSFGVNATPSMIIGKQLVIGAEPYASIQTAIETALGK